MIWGIFKRDMCHATRNVIAVIVSMGLVVVPALYAWFNIAASWDPYGNTKALKVAVANNDKGYKSDLIPVRVNVGETIISTLHANDQLDWQFVKSDKAIDGGEIRRILCGDRNSERFQRRHDDAVLPPTSNTRSSSTI